MSVASAKFTRRHLTARVLIDALTECSNVAADFTGGEKFVVDDNGSQYPTVRLEGCNPHGPARAGQVDDFAAVRVAEPVLRQRLAHFTNLVIWQQGRSFTLNFSGVRPDPSRLENRD
jgi:hypothetical protein